MNIVKPAVELLHMTDHPLQLIERAGRTCYKSEDRITPESADAFVRMLVKRGHESVLEHATATFWIRCDRGVSHELVRHRIASFSQESTRYCDYGGNGISVIRPRAIDEGTEWDAAWQQAMLQCEQSYQELRLREAPPQIASQVLPISLKTEIVVTANFREWREIMRQRLAAAAHPHMRQVMGMVHAVFSGKCPVIVEDIVPFEQQA